MKLDPSQLDAAIKLMAPIISHEIRNPMAVIGNSSYFIKTKLAQLGKTDPKIDKHVGIIEIELKHANDVLEEILRYARMKEPSPTTLSLAALVTAALAELPVPEGITLKKIFPKKGPSVHVDAELAASAIRHVVRNAFEAAFAKDAAVVTLEVTGEKDAWGMLTVTDNGPGIPDTERERLFTPFHTTKPRGIGLGLAFVRKVLERHGGSIASPKKKGSGARFELRTPTAP